MDNELIEVAGHYLLCHEGHFATWVENNWFAYGAPPAPEYPVWARVETDGGGDTDAVYLTAKEVASMAFHLGLDLPK